MANNPFERYLSKEQKLQAGIVQWFRYQYPEYLIIPLNVESKKSLFEQYLWKRMGGVKGLPDLFLPLHSNTYNGLFIELKHEDYKLLKKNGELMKNEHLEEQDKMHKFLLRHNYLALFSQGFDKTKELIEKYINNKLYE